MNIMTLFCQRLVRITLLSLCVVVPCICLAEDKVKLAEGQYGITQAPKKPANVGKTMDDWTLWELPGDLLQAEVKQHWVGQEREKGKIEQTFTFTKKMELVRYELNVSGAGEQRKISCSLKPKLISCFDGTNQSEIAVDKVPYSFVPAEFYGLDMPWYQTSLIHSETNAKAFETPVYALDDSDSNAKSALQVTTDVPASLKYLGEEKISVLGKEVNARKYEIPVFHSLVWTAADNGILLAVQVTDNGARYELTKFKSYNPSFMSELAK